MTERLIYFVAASAVLTLSPGPDILFVFAQGLTRGRAAALAVALGLCSGLIAHTALAALGVSVVFQTSAIAFNLLKIAGAGYLLLLAWRAFSEKPAAPGQDRAYSAQTGKTAMPPEPGDTKSFGALYRTGVLMNLLNPKVALFFLAFLPQFVDQDAGAVAAQMLLLGALFMAQALAIFACVALLAGALGRLLPRSRAAAKAMSCLRGTIFVLLAAWLLLAETA